MTATPAKCIACERASDEVPLIAFEFQDQTAWICTQHLPVLLHKPEQLAGKLPGLAYLPPTKHEH